MRSFLPAQSPIRDLIAMIFHNLRRVMLLMRWGRIIHDERIVMNSLKYEIVYHDINNRKATPLINNLWNQRDGIKRRSLTEFFCSEQWFLRSERRCQFHVMELRGEDFLIDRSCICPRRIMITWSLLSEFVDARFRRLSLTVLTKKTMERHNSISWRLRLI